MPGTQKAQLKAPPTSSCYCLRLVARAGQGAHPSPLFRVVGWQAVPWGARLAGDEAGAGEAVDEAWWS